MECPFCGLINPPKSSRCDCGYDFDTRAGGRQQPSPGFLQSLWFAWLIITIGDLVTLSGSGHSALWNYFPNALFNLFTPILLGNLLAKGPVLVITLPLLFVGLFAGDRAGKPIKLKSLRFIYNLVFLCALTAAIDAITWGTPKSIEHIVEASHCVAARSRSPECIP
jgi:hypothetical protein